MDSDTSLVIPIMLEGGMVVIKELLASPGNKKKEAIVDDMIVPLSTRQQQQQQQKKQLLSPDEYSESAKLEAAQTMASAHQRIVAMIQHNRAVDTLYTQFRTFKEIGNMDAANRCLESMEQLSVSMPRGGAGTTKRPKPEREEDENHKRSRKCMKLKKNSQQMVTM
ncbi:hypothetical protein IV203_012802 [Nitzschia inconspicua]|uniref:Uncharacterized protein n=1 Tax=Nitzschia inconspicua TaxID=303405 RepID=A0A9K3KU53_9STRA|nr:hypothetical protein IV203_012747 [Nitzschia inconspicua]KAG7350029.1 hypothetical protein IV203_012626 [Nitzschia inconspicua]KAG7373707.1 hypothetical protein IV203_012802 [Nitzschia inconspicua]